MSFDYGLGIMTTTTSGIWFWKGQPDLVSMAAYLFYKQNDLLKRLADW